ncbi:MAG TPA: carboxypeptidase regulatory-like domain-containing protein [Pyrinomonadaceae bacterium]|jgi:hypothetical protein
MLSRFRIFASVFGFCLLLTSNLWAQSDAARLAGTVTDAAGAIVPGASVLVKNEKTGEERTVVTGNDGTYSVTALKPSVYTITVSKTTFATTEQKSVELLVGQELNLNVTLQPEGASAVVNVVSEYEASINTSSASMSVNVNPREVQGLPLNGRQLSQLYLQAPGAQNTGSGSYGDIRFNGRATEQNAIRYDGIDGTAVIDANPGTLNGELSSPFRLQSSLENVQEFRVESSSYTAEFGTGTGGQINVVTKSGGNRFNGSVFEYIRNDALDAANYFDNIVGQKSSLRLNQFGFSVGGPIIKNKLFFFGSYEGYRLRAGINSIEAVPGDAARICAVVGAANCNATAVALLPAFRSSRAVIIARGTGSNLFDVAQLQDTAKVVENSYALRLDYRPSEKNSYYFRFFRDEGINTQPEGVTGRTLNFTARPQNAVLGWQSLFTSNAINEFKIGYNGVVTRTSGEAPMIAGIDLSKITLNISGNTANFSIPGQGTSAGTATPGGLVRANSATNGRGQPYTVYSLTFADNLTWIRGNHSLKFGVEIRPLRIWTDRLGGTTYVFNDLPSFLRNSAASIQYVGDLSDQSPFTGVSGERLAEQEYYIAYGQDEWKIRPNVTLNFGLRYEYYTPLREASNAQVLFDTTTGTLRDSREAAFKTSKGDFLPRVAATWSPNLNGNGFFGGGRTVLRAGFGIYVGPGQTEDQIQPIESDRISSTVSGGSFDPNTDAFIQNIRNSFIANPNNRNYQPRAYTSEYLVPEKIYTYTFSWQQELFYNVVATVGYVGSRGRNLFLRGLSNVLRDGNATILNGAALPTNAGVINRTNAAGQVTGVTTVRQFDILNNPAACGLSAAVVPLCRPFAEIDTKTSGGDDQYDALQITIARRTSDGLTLNAQYTLGKSFGLTSGSNEARTASQPVGGEIRPSGDQNNYEADRGRNNFDVRHNFNLSAVYDLPFGKNKKYDFGRFGNAFLGGWEIGAIFNARSGVPIDVTITRPDVVIQCVQTGGCIVPTGAGGGTTVFAPGYTANLPNLGTGFPALPAGFIAVVNAPGGGSSRQTRRPNLVAGVSPYLNNDRNFLNPAAFAAPSAGAFGDLPRNALTGPSFKQFDLIFNKRFRFSERYSLEFRTEIFNIFNRANFGNPPSTLNNPLPNFTYTAATADAPAFYSSGTGLQPGQAFTQNRAGSTFGLLRSTVERTVGLGTNRQIQFALRFNF